MNQMVTTGYQDINGIWPMPKITRTTKAARTASKYMLLRVSKLTTSHTLIVSWESEYMPYAGGSTSRERRKSMTEIAKRVLERYPDFTLAEIKGPRRSDYLIKARFAVIDAIKRERPDLSYPQIGKFLGGRDHTTIMAAVRAIAERKAKKEWDDL